MDARREKRDRVHTSTITVAVLPEPTEVTRVSRSGASSGRRAEQFESTALLTVRPTGMQARCETSRSQQHNGVAALELLRARLWALEAARVSEARAAERRGQ
jgi:peptide chain release factor 1